MYSQAVLSGDGSAKSIAWGVLLMLLGLVALAAPAATSVSFTIVLAWVLMLVGLTHMFSSWRARTLLSVARRIAVGLLYFAVGLLIQRNPVWGVTSLTVVIGAALLVESVIGLIAYLYDEDRTTSGLLSAIVTLTLGSMIINQWPSSSLWTIGTLVGVNLLVVGAAQTFLTGARHQTVRPVRPH